jgi:hypothetical protein
MTRVAPAEDHGDTSRSRSALLRRYREWVRPSTDGLPSGRVLASFPVLLLVIGALLIGIGINGTSSGEYFDDVSAGADPNLLLGDPQRTRADEWNVQTVWAIAQIEQGLPAVNETFPGGMDTTLPQDLPRVDWTVAFRPHLWGFMLLPVDNAFAWKWWIPGLALMAAAFAFVVTLMPRRPGVAAMLSVAFFFSPLFQWWYLSTTLWPVVWGLVTITAIVWGVRSSSRRARWWWAGAVGYLTVVMATGIYVPFIVPVALVVVAFAIGTIVAEARAGRGVGWIVGRASPVVLAAVVGSGVVIVWLVQKREIVAAFLGTAYPGERSTPAGGGDVLSLASVLGSSFTQALNVERSGFLGPNSSEASTFLYLGVLLLPVVVWLVVRDVRDRRGLDWPLLCTALVVLVLIAFIFVSGWDAIARVLLLDKTIHARVRIGIGLGSFVMLVLLVRALEARRTRVGLVLAGLIAVGYVASQAAIALFAARNMPSILEAAPLWWLWTLLAAAALFLFARGRVTLPSAAFLTVAVAGSALTNPVYVGVLDLRDTSVSHAVQRIDDRSGGTWVGVGSGLTTAMLLESGVEALNGFQGAPSEALWGEIDPDGSHAYQWNRLAGLLWTSGPGEPVPSNPAGDQILMNFDACSAFAERNVDWVLSDEAGIDTTCLAPAESFDLPDGPLTIYEVTGSGAG